MKMLACKFSQDEVTHQKLRVFSKKHALSLSKGPSKKADLPPRLRVEALQRVVREAVPSKARNAAGGFFQQTHYGDVVRSLTRG